MDQTCAVSDTADDCERRYLLRGCERPLILSDFNEVLSQHDFSKNEKKNAHRIHDFNNGLLSTTQNYNKNNRRINGA